MVCNPFCCSSIRRGAKRIALMDIILFFITVCVSIGLEWSVFNSIPRRLVLFDDGTGMETQSEEMTISEESNDKHMVGKAIWIHVSHAIKNASEVSVALGYLMYMGLLLAMMGYFILEIWLCCVLIRAATEKRPEFCRKWLWCRSVLLFVTVGMTVINLLQMQYTITDITVQPLNLLRLYSIFAVIQLRKKLIKTDPKLVY